MDILYKFKTTWYILNTEIKRLTLDEELICGSLEAKGSKGQNLV